MPTPLILSNLASSKKINAKSIVSLALALACVALSVGCGQSQGALLYMLGVGKAAKVSAEFEFSEGPLLILIDDPAERIEGSKTKKYLFDELSQNLLRAEATAKIIPLQTLVNLQQSLPGFEKRGCREVGERVGADEVLWIEVQDYSATQNFENITAAAFATVAVKVINVHETQRSRVRRWPPSPVGRRITVSLTGSEVAVHKSKGAIARVLADRLAMRIARLFYEYQPGDFEKTQ